MLPERARGFTLLEMLVALLIAGMALALTTQALGQYQRAHTRATAGERGAREYRLSEAWFREAVRGLYPASREGQDGRQAVTRAGTAQSAPRFSGDGDGFTGVTLSPLLAHQGVPVVQHWRVTRSAGRSRLEVEETGQRIVLALPPARSLVLHYVDSEGKLHEQWPPALGQWPQLPAAVILELDSDVRAGAPGLIAAAILGPKDPLGPIESAYEYAPP